MQLDVIKNVRMRDAFARGYSSQLLAGLKDPTPPHPLFLCASGLEDTSYSFHFAAWGL